APVLAALLWIASALALRWARRSLERYAYARFRLATVAAAVAACAGYALALLAQAGTGLTPTEHVYGAIVYAIAALQGLFLAVVLGMTAYLLARSWAGRLDGIRRVTFDNCRLYWLYTAGQGLAGIALVYGAPLLAGSGS